MRMIDVQAWAVVLESDANSRVFCVFADNKQSAIGKAFVKLEEELENDNEDEEEVEDYRPTMYDATTVRVNVEQTVPLANSKLLISDALPERPSRDESPKKEKGSSFREQINNLE